MMIGVVADTHSHAVPRQLLEELKKVDLIVHAGDFCSLKEYNLFAKIKPLEAVFGNMDEPPLRRQLPESKIFEWQNFKIGLYHGEGAPDRVLEKIQAKFQGKKCDAVIFGHSHQPFNQRMGETLYFNPGSPNDTIFAPFFSYGLIEVKEGKLVGTIVKLKGDG